MLLCVLLTTILAQAPPEAAATEPAEVCEKAELRAKLGECFRSTIGAIECLSNPPHEDNEEKPSKALIMCLCIAKLEKVRRSLAVESTLIVNAPYITHSRTCSGGYM